MTKNIYLWCVGWFRGLNVCDLGWCWTKISFRKKRRCAEIYYLHHFPIQPQCFETSSRGVHEFTTRLYHLPMAKKGGGGWEIHMVGQLRSWLVTRNEIRHWWQVIRKGTFSSIQTFSCYCYWGGFTSPDLHLASVRLSDWVTWVCFFFKVLHHLLDRKVIISKRHTLLPTTIFSVEHGHPFGDCVLIF